MEEQVLLEARELSYQYEDGTNALCRINLKLKRGEKLAVMGANGSGKSTLFLNLVGVLKPGMGQILYEGSPVEYSRKGLRELRSKVGIVFQDPENQLFSSSVFQEISFGPMNLSWEEDRVRKAVNHVIQSLSITPFQEKPTHFLSGGQKKQVSLADIIVMEPEVILMDEPTAALDPKNSEVVNKIIDGLCERGITVVISTHDVDYALAWADQVAVFNEGCLERFGTPEEVFRDKELMKRTNLLLPRVLQIYDTLVEAGQLKEVSFTPQNIEMLSNLIRQSPRKGETDGTSI